MASTEAEPVRVFLVSGVDRGAAGVPPATRSEGRQGAEGRLLDGKVPVGHRGLGERRTRVRDWLIECL